MTGDRASGDAPTFEFRFPEGAEALFAPDSVQWRIYKNEVALGIGGICAVLLEFADPRIRSGVWDHSTFSIDPMGRSERTMLAALATVYGARESAERMIGGIDRMHAGVTGATPDGRRYAALDPELLNWVAATAGYGFLNAYDRFVQPLTTGDRDRYWTDGARLVGLYGTTDLPRSDADFERMLDTLAPGFEPHEINVRFLDIVRTTDRFGPLPGFARRAVVRAAVSLLPPRVRERLALGPGHVLTRRDRLCVRAIARIVERRSDPASPPARASERLGLPARFLWRSPAEQADLLQAWSRRSQPG